MPTYEYRCVNGHDFEEFFLKISAAKSELPCPTCGERGERRLSAGGGLLFKGSGFYITDYGKDGKKTQSAPRKDTGSASSSATKSEAATSASPKADSSTSDAKPASTPPATPSKGSE